MRGIALMILALGTALHAGDTGDRFEMILAIALVILSIATFKKETE